MSRITAVGVWGILLLVGILALSGIPGLHALGTGGGATLTATGSLVLSGAFCLHCVNNARGKQATQPHPFFHFYQACEEFDTKASALKTTPSDQAAADLLAASKTLRGIILHPPEGLPDPKLTDLYQKTFLNSQLLAQLDAFIPLLARYTKNPQAVILPLQDLLLIIVTFDRKDFQPLEA